MNFGNFAIKDGGSKEIPKPNQQNMGEVDKSIDIDKPLDYNKKELTPLTEKEKEKLKEETGWSSEIIDTIASKEEAEIYKNASLEEREINGKKCLVKTDIDMEQKDEYGRSNKERMEAGLAPLDKDGKPTELHHMGQKKDGPLVELTREEHRGKGNDTVLHDKSKQSEIDRSDFQGQKANHWQERAQNS